MKDWIKKPWNAFLVVCTLICAICTSYGGIHLYKYLSKGISVLQLKSSVTELVVYSVMTLAGLLLFLIGWKVRWSAMVLDQLKKNTERLDSLEKKLNGEV